ncbi:hypothetical protein INT46_009206 [Mucor plumbeus]|uniref:Uncharacterized protein n=1 Tax=Mucor plumbeus TaxID=97098 RepID=A0A8H7QN39_9FUNG|nr:hypothetical protein INT46_009206 [Mucor plumbeus]
MTRTLSYDVQDSIKSLLLHNTLLCSIKKMYPTVGMANLSKHRREFLEGAQASTSGRSSKVSTASQYTANKKLRLAWARKHRQLTVSDWRKWVFSGKTRVNMWGSDSESFYWSDVPGTNRPHQVRPQVQGSGDGVMLLGCISGDGSGYSTAIIDRTIDSNNQNGFFVEKILDWSPQNPDLNPIEHIRGDLKRHLDAYPNRPATK